MKGNSAARSPSSATKTLPASSTHTSSGRARSDHAHQMAARVDAVQQPIHTHGDRVRHFDRAIAKRSYEGSVGCEDDDRVVVTARAVAARQQIHIVVCANGDAWHVADRPALG